MAKSIDINKGKIRDNALKALVKSNIFRCKTEKKRKGRGSYNRQQAKRWQDGSFEPSCLFFYAQTNRWICIKMYPQSKRQPYRCDVTRL